MVENAVLADESLVSDKRYDTDTCYGKGADTLRRTPLVLIASPVDFVISLGVSYSSLMRTYQMIAIINGRTETMNKPAPIQSKRYIC
jgi:hypothetical protein